MARAASFLFFVVESGIILKMELHLEFVPEGIYFAGTSRDLRSTLPDCILLDCEATLWNSLKKEFKKCQVTWEEWPFTFHKRSGKPYIHATQFHNLMQCLITLQATQKMVCPFENFSEMARKTKTTIPPLLKLTQTQRDFEAAAIRNRDWKACAVIAETCKDEYKIRSLAWLNLMLTDLPPHTPSPIDISSFVSTFAETHQCLEGDIFLDIHPTLLKSLQESAFTKVSYDNQESAAWINKSFSDFMLQSKTVSTLDLHRPPMSNFRIGPPALTRVSHICAQNTYLETLELSDQRIGDAGAELILDSLMQNKKNRLRTLSLFATGISKRTINVLSTFLDLPHCHLEEVNLEWNTSLLEEDKNLFLATLESKCKKGNNPLISKLV